MSLNCYSKGIAIFRRFSERIGAGDLCHPYSFTIEEIKINLESQGFKLIESTYDPEKETKLKMYKDPFKKSVTQKLLNLYKLGGVVYLFKRILITPFYYIFIRLGENYPSVFFICKKTEENKKDNIYMYKNKRILLK